MRAIKIKSWWKKYRILIMCLLGTYVIVMLVLIFLSGGPQREPFLYQIF
jgi:hypothetical protein